MVQLDALPLGIRHAGGPEPGLGANLDTAHCQILVAEQCGESMTIQIKLGVNIGQHAVIQLAQGGPTRTALAGNKRVLD